MAALEQKMVSSRSTEDNDIRRLKKTAEETPESLRKNKNKSVLPEDSLQNKITKYIVSSSQSRPPLPIPVQPTTLSSEERVAQLEEKLREKDKIISELKEKKEAEEQRANNLAFNAREYKRKTRLIVAKSML